MADYRVPDRPLTWRDYAAMPDGFHGEIIGGEFVRMRSRETDHQRVLANVLMPMALWLDTNPGHGTVLNWINLTFEDTDAQATVVNPDLVFIGADRRSRIATRGIEGPPTLVAEVTAEDTDHHDRFTKRALYAMYGVPEYWIIDRTRAVIDVLRPAESGYRLAQRARAGDQVTTPNLPGFVLAVDDVFRDRHVEPVRARIKELRDARPFRPFNVQLGDGRACRISSPDHIFLVPGDDTFLAVDAHGRMQLYVDLSLVTAVEALT